MRNGLKLRRWAVLAATASMVAFTVPALAKTRTPKHDSRTLNRAPRPKSIAVASHHVDPRRLRAHVALLANDELGGRGTGSHGIDLAAGYIAGQFASAGLLPGGPNGTYFQDFDVVVGGTPGKKTSLRVDGLEKTIVVDKDFRPFDFSTTGAFDGELAFVGYGITAPDENYDDYAGLDVEGKVALMIRREPEFLSPDGGPSRHATFESKIKLASKHGAIAVLIANDTRGDREDRLRLFRPRGVVYGLPAVHVKKELANILLHRSGRPAIEKLQAQIEGKKKPISFMLTGVTMHGIIDAELETVVARNVIGLLPGNGPASDHCVVIGGHYDHLGTRGGEVYNGADDNASGTAGVIELARQFARVSYRNRSMLFMSFSGEEMGLLGSRYYVAHPTVALEKISAMLNMDMIGKLKQNGNGKRLIVQGLGTGSSFKRIVEKNAAAASLTFEPDDSARGPSDHASFYEGGIPSLFFFTGVHEDYHQPGDDTEKVDFDGAAHILELVYSVANDLVNAEAPPVFAKVDKRAVIRRGPGGGPPRVVMGIMPDMEDSGQGGWRVAEVFPQSGAAKAGMKSGDRILKIDGKKISGFRDYRKITKDKKPGDVIVVTVRRGDRQLDLSVELGSAG